MEHVAVVPMLWLVALLIGGAFTVALVWTRLWHENDSLQAENEELQAQLEGREPARRPEPRRAATPARGMNFWLKPALASLLLAPCLGLAFIVSDGPSEALPPRLAAPQVLKARIVVPRNTPEAGQLDPRGVPRPVVALEECSPLSLRQATQMAQYSGRREGVSTELILAVIFHESSFSPCAVSSSGAQGLMQLKPATAWEVGVKNPFDPNENIAGGTRYLSYLLRRYKGNVPLALGAYKDGMSVVDRHRGVPPEEGTRKYVRGIIEMAEQLSAD